jgi:FtsH-binding integral membrane protein
MEAAMYASQHYGYKHRVSSRQDIKALLFFVGIVAFMLGSIFLAYASSGPIVLGTELNTNGMVEYLCLGNGCDHLQDMDW